MNLLATQNSEYSQKIENIRNGNSRFSMNSFHRLQRRQLNGKLPNSFWDYHLRALPVHFVPVDKKVTDLVIADDLICVFRHDSLIPFRREGKMLPLTDEYGKRIILDFQMEIRFANYNSHNNSLIMVGNHESLPYLRILSVEIASIKAGQTDQYREIYAEEANRNILDLDIPNCRGIIYNEEQRVLKVFDLKEYNEIFTIRVERNLEWYFESRGNMYVVKYFHGLLANNTSAISFRIYSKEDGELFQEALVYFNPQIPLLFASLCGEDRVCLQHVGGNLEMIDISGEVPQVIPTNLEVMVEPYCLDKLNRFLCYTVSGRLHICNMRGEVLNTLEDHPMHIGVFIENDFYSYTYITRGQDIAISLCGPEEFDGCTIYINSIISGDCLAKITSKGGSEIRQAALSDRIVSLAYDERTREIFTASENGICCVWSKNFPSDDRELPDIPADDVSDDVSE